MLNVGFGVCSWLIPPFPPIYAAACKLYPSFSLSSYAAACKLYPDDAQWGSTTMRLMLAYFVFDSLVVPLMLKVSTWPRWC